MTSISNNDKQLKALISDVTFSLLGNKPYQVPGLGKFSICTRKATVDRAECQVVMFRACAELRDHVLGGKKPEISGTHAKVTQIIIEAMQSESGVEIPGFGHMAVVSLSGKCPKLTFHASKEFDVAIAISR